MTDTTSVRDELLSRVKSKYGGELEYPWPRFPRYSAVRHSDNQKCYMIFVRVTQSKLGEQGDDIVEVVNLKMSDPLMVDFLAQQEGYYPGARTMLGNWISVSLDGTVPVEEILNLVEISFLATASAKTRHRLRPPKEWVVPSNLRYFDTTSLFDHTDTAEWKQGKGIKANDIVFLYAGHPVSAILYKCIVEETDIPYNRRFDGVTILSLMRLRLLKRYPQDAFPFETLKNEYGVGAIRGPRGIPDRLSKELNRE